MNNDNLVRFQVAKEAYIREVKVIKTEGLDGVEPHTLMQRLVDNQGLEPGDAMGIVMAVAIASAPGMRAQSVQDEDFETVGGIQ